jgi:aspartate aminotransferase-like enzyme
MPLFAAPERMVATITAAYCPPDVLSTAIRDYLLRECNLQITTGFGPFKEGVIRIGIMGGALTDADIDALVAGLRAFTMERVAS